MRICRYILWILALSVLAIPKGYAYENLVYIWQRDWDGFVQDGISKIHSDTNGFIVLGGDFKYENGKSSINSVNIDWSYFEEGTAVTFAFRINSRAKELFKTNAVNKVVNSIQRVFDRAKSSAKNKGVTIKGIQFDYDCPTLKLSDYNYFLAVCKKNFPDIEISITALPTWLNSKDFKDLIKHTAYYVLQLHSFERPKTINQAKKIFLREHAPLYVEKASKVGHPYYISLPTYGYEVAFGNDGKFLGMRAEVEPISLGNDIQYQTVMADPNEILTFLQYLQKVKPRSLLGVSWFRMPIKIDEFNWHIDTLKAVIENRKPSISFSAKIVSPQEGLYELHLINNGEQNILNSVSVITTWPKGSLVLYDILGQYQEKTLQDKNGIVISGFPPKVGNKVIIAWFRNATRDNKDISIKVSEVVVNETSQ